MSVKEQLCVVLEGARLPPQWCLDGQIATQEKCIVWWYWALQAVDYIRLILCKNQNNPPHPAHLEPGAVGLVESAISKHPTLLQGFTPSRSLHGEANGGESLCCVCWSCHSPCFGQLEQPPPLKVQSNVEWVFFQTRWSILGCWVNFLWLWVLPWL